VSWEDVQALRKAGRFREAIALALDLLTKQHDRRVRTQLDWSWYGLIKGLVEAMAIKLKAAQPVPPDDVDRLLLALHDYSNQPAIRPDNPLSNIVREISKVAAHVPDFPDFLRWVDINGLALEDWQYQQRDGKTYRPVAHAAARGLAKWVKAHRGAEPADISLAQEWLDRARPVATGDDALWLDWDRALMLRRLGEYRKAAETLSDVLKAKRGEFWVWAEAARLYAEEQPDLARACFCRALQCGSEDKFTVNVHRELAELLAHEQNYGQASSEVARAIEIRQQQGWSIDPPLQQLIDSAWYDPTADGIEDPKTFYARHSSDALVLCFDQVEAKPATYLGLLIPHPPKDPPPGWKARPLPRFAILDSHRKSISLVGPGLRHIKHEVGAPVTVVVGRQNDDGRATIVQVASRPDGMSWDCTQQGLGVVVREAAPEKPMKVYIGRDSDDVSVDGVWLGKEPAQLGQGVRFQFTENAKNGRRDLFAVQKGPLPDDDVKLVRGRLRRNPKGFAFVDDAFVPPHVVETVAKDVEDVAALIVYAKHPTKDEYGWHAVKLSAA
jgi:tetratricopeptide (TPR) repeat protein